MGEELIGKYIEAQDINVIGLAHINSVTDQVWQELLNDDKTIVIEEYKDELLFCYESDLHAFALKYDISGESDKLETILTDDLMAYVMNGMSIKYPLIHHFEGEIQNKMPSMIKDAISDIRKHLKEHMFDKYFVENVEIGIEALVLREVAAHMEIQRNEYLKQATTSDGLRNLFKYMY